MKSMTGYAYNEYQNEDYSLSVEIKSYNNKFLDIIINSPHYLNPLEPEIRKLISSTVRRGRVEVFIKYKSFNEDIVLNLDKNVLNSYKAVLDEVVKESGVKGEVTLDHLLSFEDLIKSEKKSDIDIIGQRVKPLLQTTLDEYDKSRAVEGQTILDDILEKIVTIEKHAAVVEENADKLEQKIKDDIKKRFEELEIDAIDNSRIVEETAVLLVKYSINEEISRMKAHLASFREIASSSGSVGKKLDFLCQELNREINTIGSKSILIELNRAVIEVKDSIEMIREQLRNAE